MTPFFVWLLKSSVSLALLYVVFKLAVSRNKMHTANRFVLLGILLSSVLLPFADIPVFRETTVVPQFEVIHEFIATPQEISVVPTQNKITETIAETPALLSAINWWVVLYLSMIGVLVIRLVFSMARVLLIIRRAEKQNFGDVILAIVKDFIQPFSFLQHIVLSEKDFTENKDIVLTHEYAHIQHKHAIDLMICELFTALFWFNPFMWLLRRELKLIHEYQADEAVLNKGIDAKTYQLLVLKKAVGERRFALANNFTQKPILKRIKMMHMKNNKRWTSLKLALFVPVVALLLQAFSKPELIVEKAEAYLPVIAQQDSSQVWIDSWVSSKMDCITSEEYFKDNQPLSITDSDQPINEKNTFHKKNVFIILQNSKGELLVENERLELKDLEKNLESFLKGKNEITQEIPDNKSEEFPIIGKVNVSQGIILYRQDVVTSPTATKSVMNEIAEAILSVRQETAHAKFSTDYFSLSTDKKEVVNQIIPGTINFQIPKGTKRTSEITPLPSRPRPVDIKITDDGRYLLGIFEPKYQTIKWRKALTKSELRDYIEKGRLHAAEKTKEYNRKYQQQVLVLVEEGVNDRQVNELKEFLSSLDNLRVVFSTDRTEEEFGAFSSSQVGKSDIIVYADRMLAFDKPCTLEEVKEKVEDGIKTMGNKKTISVLAFSDVSKERLDAVLNELNQIPFKKVSTTVLAKEQKPVSLAQHKVLLKANGKIDIDSKEYDLNEFQSRINEIGSQSSKTNVAFEVENDVTYIQIETVKQMLREANIDQVGYSIHKHYVRETETGTKIGESTNMFWTSGNGSPDLVRVKRAAENFLSGNGNRSLYAGITPDKNATKEDIDAVKQVLQDAGFLKVNVRESRN